MPTKRRSVARFRSGSAIAEMLARGSHIPHTAENEGEVRQIFDNGIDNTLGERAAPFLCSFARAQLVSWGLPAEG